MRGSRKHLISDSLSTDFQKYPVISKIDFQRDRIYEISARVAPLGLASRSHAFSEAWRISLERLVPWAGIPARPIRLQDFATSRKSPPLFGRVARVQEKPGRSAVFVVLPWRKGTAGLENKAFPFLQPHSLSVYSSPSGRISSHRLRLPPVKVRVTELSVTTP